MEPKSLSASSSAVFELCPARFKAENLNRSPDIDNDAASLGTACHEVCELWVADGHYLLNLAQSDIERIIGELYEAAYWKVMADRERYDEGLALCMKWVERQDWTGRTVLTTEVKKYFEVPTSIGPIPFNYIMDRMDRMDDGDIEVVDYKTVMAPVQPDDLKKRIQPRAYALAAQIEHPDAQASG